MVEKREKPVDWEALLNGIFSGKTIIECGMDRNVFRQGQPADSLFYLRRGKIKLTVISQQGKEAIVAILGAGSSSARDASPAKLCVWQRLLQ